MFRRYQLRDFSFLLVVFVVTLSYMGIRIIGSANEDYQSRQMYGLILGIILMLTLSLIDYTWLMNFSWIMYIIAVVLLAAVLIMGRTVNNATRWIVIAGIQFQPSDLTKIVLILFFSGLFSKNEDRLNTFRFIMMSLVLLAIPLVLILREPDLSTSIATAIVFCVIIFAAGLSGKIIGGILLVAVPSVILFFNRILQPDQTLWNGYQLRRILAWLRPEDYPEIAYQQQNSIIAIGSGQLYGKGLNNNMVSSVKGGGFIIEPQTDFIFAVAGEELGFVGCLIIIVLELLIALECIHIGRKARDSCGMMICCGMAGLIAAQSFMNMAVATGLMPNTGIPLPFVSYGVTSLITLCSGLGIVLNVGLQSRKTPTQHSIRTHRREDDPFEYWTNRS